MKAKVKNGMSDAADIVVEVRSLNYKYVSGVLPGAYEKVKVPYEDVEFIFDNEWEKNIVKYRDLLHICLPKGVSPRFYGALAHAVEVYFQGEIYSIGILSDIEEKVRRKYWYKRIVVLINNMKPVIITVSGKEYLNTYNINIEEIDSKALAVECRKGICRLKKIIDMSGEQIKLYERVIYQIEHPCEPVQRAIEGR